MYVCVSDIDFVSNSPILLLDFGTAPTAWYFFSIISLFQ
jgi:hypothetical protein